MALGNGAKVAAVPRRVARIERSVIRDKLTPDYPEFIIGPAEGRTRWLHPGYQAATRVVRPRTPGPQYLYSVGLPVKM